MEFGFGEACALACALCWAIAVILFKKAGESTPPFALNYLKNCLCLVALAITVWVLRGPWPGMPAQDLAITMLSGALGIAVADTLYFRALNAIGAARMGIAGTAYSPSVIVLAALLLGERLNALQVVGVVVTLGGIALVNGTPHQQISTAILRRGAALGVLSVATMALGVVLVKPVLERQDFLWVVTLRVVAGVILMTGQMLLTRQTGTVVEAVRRIQHWPQVVAGSLMGTYVSMLFWLAGYKYANASIAAVLNELAAIFIVLMAAWLLRERIVARQWAGAGVALAGVVVVVWAR